MSQETTIAPQQQTQMIPQEIIKQAEMIQEQLRHPNPQISVNYPLLPVYLGEISPLNPVNKILPELNLVKILNHV